MFMQAHNNQKSTFELSNNQSNSSDGYLRMTFESFRRSQLVHLFSGLDEDRPARDCSGASYSAITGYTEWISESQPLISVGWDWKLTGFQGIANLIHSGIPGSNLMFVCQQGNDIGLHNTRQLLENWITTFSWQTETLNAIST